MQLYGPFHGLVNLALLVLLAQDAIGASNPYSSRVSLITNSK